MPRELAAFHCSSRTSTAWRVARGRLELPVESKWPRCYCMRGKPMRVAGCNRWDHASESPASLSEKERVHEAKTGSFIFGVRDIAAVRSVHPDFAAQPYSCGAIRSRS